MLTHGCIGPTHLFHIKPSSARCADRMQKYGYSFTFRCLNEIFLDMSVLTGILAQTRGL